MNKKLLAVSLTDGTLLKDSVFFLPFPPFPKHHLQTTSSPSDPAAPTDSPKVEKSDNPNSNCLITGTLKRPVSVVACYLRSRQSRHNIICFEMLVSGDSGGRLPCIFLKTPFGTTKGTTIHRRARWKRLQTVSPIRTRKAAAIYHDENKSRARIGPLNLCESMGFDSYVVLFLFFLKEQHATSFFWGPPKRSKTSRKMIDAFQLGSSIRWVPQFLCFTQLVHVGVSKNRGTSKWMVYKGNPY